MSNFFVEPGKDFLYCPGMTDTEILDAIRDGRSRAWLARALKVPYHTCYGWYRLGRIPRRWHRRVIEFAARQGITVTEEELR